MIEVTLDKIAMSNAKANEYAGNRRKKCLNQKVLYVILSNCNFGQGFGYMIHKLIALACSMLLFAGAVAAQDGTVAPDAAKGYLIGPGDIMTINVLGEEQFAVSAITVDDDGKIQVPYSDGIVVQCKTEKEVRDMVVKIYSRLIKNPQVSVYVKERKSRPPATIYGEVRTPGPIQLTRRATLRELLAFSGGVTKDASGMIQITRTQRQICAAGADEDWASKTDADYGFASRLYSLGSLKQTNPEILPGDIVDVQKASPVYVVGEVLKPTELTLPEGGLPLTQAIAMANGITREAKTKLIKIHRRKEGSAQAEIITVNFDLIRKGEQKDVMLQPFDIVEVDKAKKKFGDILYEALINAPNRLPIPIRPF